MSRAKHPSGILKAAAQKDKDSESTLSGGVAKKSVRIENKKRRAKPGSGNFRRVITLQMGDVGKSTLMRYQPFSRLMRNTIKRICKDSNLRLVNKHKTADGKIKKIEFPFNPRVSDNAIEDAKQYAEAKMHRLLTVAVDSAVTSGHKQVSRRDFRFSMVTDGFVPRESVFKVMTPSGAYDPHKPVDHEDRAEPKRERVRHVRNATVQMDVFRRPRQHKTKEQLEEEAQAKSIRKKERAQKAMEKAARAEKRARKAAAAVAASEEVVVADKKQPKAKKSKKRAAEETNDDETAAGSIDEIGREDEDEVALIPVPRKALGKKQAVAGKKRAAAASK